MRDSVYSLATPPPRYRNGISMLPDSFSAPSLQKWLQNSRDGSGNKTTTKHGPQGIQLVSTAPLVIRAGCLPDDGLLGGCPDGCTSTVDDDISVHVGATSLVAVATSLVAVATSLVAVAISLVDVGSPPPLDCTTTVIFVPGFPMLPLGSKMMLIGDSGGEIEVVCPVSSSGTELEGIGSTGLEAFKVCKYSWYSGGIVRAEV